MTVSARLSIGVAGTLLASAVGLRLASNDEASRALVKAAASGEVAGVSAALRSGANPNARDASGRPALVLAVASGRPETVRALLHGGADPNQTDRSGWSGLHQAAESGGLEAARALLDAGAEPDLRSRSRSTPLDVAEQKGETAIARLLRARGARGSGKSIGDTVCVRPWRGEGYCATVEAVDRTRYRLHVTEVVGCGDGCASDGACSSGESVGGPTGLKAGDTLWVQASCLTHTGVR
jgi:hypothetical protein